MDSTQAYDLAEKLLADFLPRRWAHSQGVARRAVQLAPILGSNADLVHSAALLHDIGCSPAIGETGFHPLDGARFLRSEGVDERIVRLVAHHSCALWEARERRLDLSLAEAFEPPNPELADALAWCDMTTSLDGTPVSLEDRLDEVYSSNPPEHVLSRAFRLAAPELAAAITRVEGRRMAPSDE
jgi:putative nucleotidyltransferase with HDIG domain